MGIFWASRTFRTPICAKPLDAPAPRTTAIVAGLRRAGGSGGVVAHAANVTTRETMNRDTLNFVPCHEANIFPSIFFILPHRDRYTTGSFHVLCFTTF